MSQVPISALPPLATPLNPALQFEVAQGTATSSKVTLTQILTDPIITGSPTITDFTLSLHDHSDNSDAGQLTNTALLTGEFTAITGLGTQSTDLNMGIQNILQSGFLELREITIPAVPADTAGRLYTRDVAGTTTLFFLNSLGVETDLLDIGLGTFLPLAGGTMEDGAVITFINSGSGANPTISVTPSSFQTLTISDNLLVPTTIFLGNAGWFMDINDADTDFEINSPDGNGSHNFDIISDSGEISLQNTTSTNDFTAKFFVEQFSALATTQDIAFTIEAQIVDGTDEGDSPVIAINARQAAANIDTRPIFGILNNGNNLWEINKDGIVTQQNDLDINSNSIKFQNWSIKDEVGITDKLNIQTLNGEEGVVRFSNNNIEYEILLGDESVGTLVSQSAGGSIDPEIIVHTHFIAVKPLNDVTSDKPIYDIRLQREGGTEIVNRPLVRIRNHLTQAWLLDNDGTVTQSGNLVMGSNLIIFTSGNSIKEVGGNLQIRSTNTIDLFANTNDAYTFGDLQSNWKERTMVGMGTLQFGSNGLVSIQRDSSSGNNLELDANTGGEILLRIGDSPAWTLDTNGNVTQTGDLVMVQNAITFGNWKVDNTNPGNNFLTWILDQDIGFIQKSTNKLTDETSYRDVFLHLLIQKSQAAITTDPILEYQVRTTADNDNASGDAVIVFNAQRNNLEPITTRPLFAIENDDAVRWIIDADGTVTQTGDLNMTGNDLTNGAIINGTFLVLKQDTDIPILQTIHTRPSPATGPIFEQFSQGENSVSDPKVYVQMISNQDNITPGSETGSLDFDILINNVDLLLMKLDGLNNTLLLGPDTSLSFTDDAETGTLLLDTNTDDNLTFEGSRVKTGTTIIDDLAITQTPVTTTEVDITGLAFNIADQDQGLGRITLFILATPGQNNQQAIFRIFLDGIFIFGKTVRIGNNGDDNTPITLVTTSLLTGTELKATAQAVSGTFDVEAGSDLSIFQVF